MVGGETSQARRPTTLVGLPRPRDRLRVPDFNLLPVLIRVGERRVPAAARRRAGRPSGASAVGTARRGRPRSQATSPDQLSGGQRQRVAIARALAPPAASGAGRRADRQPRQQDRPEIIRLMRSMHRERTSSFIFSSHDPKVIDMADRLIMIEDGQVRRLGINDNGTWIYAENPDRRGAERRVGDSVLPQRLDDGIRRPDGPAGAPPPRPPPHRSGTRSRSRLSESWIAAV